jgi:hypothetical protein
MKFTKLCGSFAVAASILGMSGIASADDYPFVCNEGSLIAAMQHIAQDLRCKPDGDWAGPAIWRKGRTASCDIQTSLAKQLDEPRTAEDAPPPVGGKNGKGGNLAAGAANDLLNGKVDDAKLHIANYLAGIDKANVNDSFGTYLGMSASGWSMWFRNYGEDFQGCLEDLYPTTL